jgi:hypothetical protein
MFSKRNIFSMALFTVGIHSILLGIFIYFMTDLFYSMFFSSEVVNLFFVKQSGLFLFLTGLFYLVPLTNLEKLSRVTVVTIISKICAVIFLFSNAIYTPAPFMIYLAGFGDGCMAIALLLTYVMFKREITPKALS